ncbi:hypothetical protein E1B28_003444 [Marasmius oreades]|uniref:Uncharacterized protein n=1 Tax=Marasmius oreades TaxID=181124 RepID=A0A9P7UKU6_9AGAR|nr:uncharacterized protein E1B28_003444 [Marasmius oreades]KAG7085910.1 hypothetical protein E1B28_003444 [Marasmius oreades]
MFVNEIIFEVGKHHHETFNLEDYLPCRFGPYQTRNRTYGHPKSVSSGLFSRDSMAGGIVSQYKPFRGQLDETTRAEGAASQDDRSQLLGLVRSLILDSGNIACTSLMPL